MKKSSDMQPGDLRVFGYGCGSILILVFGVVIPFLRHGVVAPYLIGSGLAVLLLSLCAPVVLRPFYAVWTRIAGLLAWINTRLILGSIYFGIITPTGMVRRLRGYDPLHLRTDPAKETFRELPESFPVERMERPF